MARLEQRRFKSKSFLLVIAESEAESKMIDQALSAAIPTKVSGFVELADGYGEHYIRLTKGEK